MFLTPHKIKRLTAKIKSYQDARVHNQPSESALKGEIAACVQLAEIYESLVGKKEYPFAREAALACYYAASVLEDAGALYTLGKKLLDEARFRESIQKEQVFASPNNERDMKLRYEEALACLTKAQQLNHVEARRLHGLCYVNGWGVTADQNKGLELIVESINQENSWEKVPQIFAAMGLNKPEFFAALMQRKR